MDDLRFCFQGCCHFINNRSVSLAEYNSFQRPLFGSSVAEVQIPCRNNPGDFQRAIEDSVGFYLGLPVKRAFGALLPTGGRAIVIDGRTGARLREATDGDIKKWNDAWSRLVAEKKEKKEKHADGG